MTALWYEVTVGYRGQRFTGLYSVSRGMVTVKYKGEQETTQIDGSTEQAVAEMLLQELAIVERE